MTNSKEEIRAVLERAQKLEKTTPDWVHRVEQINQQQYERSKSLACSEIERQEKDKTVEKRC